MVPQDCICLQEPQAFDQYETTHSLGVDKTNGRYGEVNVWRCKRCGRHWLHYLVEYESERNSGRIFMGLIPAQLAESLTPDKAVDYLDGLDWHLYGGSYFGGKGRSSNSIATELI